MFDPFPEAHLEQARVHRHRLLAEAERERLYRLAVADTNHFPGAALLLLAGDLFITVGQRLKRWAQPVHQPGALVNARIRSA